MKKEIKIAIITNFPSHYQVDLFNEIHLLNEIDIKVFYLRNTIPGRQWKSLQPISHNHCFVKELRIHPHFYLNIGLFKSIKKYSPDIVIVCQYASIAMQLAMCYFKIRRINWIFWSEAPGVQYTELPIINNNKLRVLLRKLSLLPIRSWPVEIWGIGNRARKIYEKLSNVPCKNFSYYSDLSPFLSGKKQFVNPDNIRFLFAGKFVYRKGFDILLETVELLALEGVSFHLTIIGDGPMKEKLSTLTSKAKDKITHAGFKEIADIPKAMREHDVFLFPSRYDGWGMVIIEAMASGLPVITSNDVGSAIDSVIDKVNGIIVENQSPESYCNAVKWFVKNGQEISQMSNKAITASKEFHTEIGAKKFVINILNNFN